MDVCAVLGRHRHIEPGEPSQTFVEHSFKRRVLVADAYPVCKHILWGHVHLFPSLPQQLRVAPLRMADLRRFVLDHEFTAWAFHLHTPFYPLQGQVRLRE